MNTQPGGFLDSLIVQIAGAARRLYKWPVLMLGQVSSGVFAPLKVDADGNVSASTSATSKTFAGLSAAGTIPQGACNYTINFFSGDCTATGIAGTPAAGSSFGPIAGPNKTAIVLTGTTLSAAWEA